jgi:hypothetical protein
MTAVMAVPEGEMLIERRACRRVNVLFDYDGIILVDVPSFKTTGRLINLGENGFEKLQYVRPFKQR